MACYGRASLPQLGPVRKLRRRLGIMAKPVQLFCLVLDELMEKGYAVKTAERTLDEPSADIADGGDR